ncbi:nucleoside hydrolase-like domain-containing protein [Mangrovibacterium sp.]|uniref:nucleoside hydrolase-like domain-containing protein n=1 Tax=Mangrovibacterium sp. TaxID=1961364 RepID=UPI00356AB715
MNTIKSYLFFLAFFLVSGVLYAQPRVVILTDFPPVDVIPGGAGYGPAEKRSDSDDVQSMVRFLLYTNDLDVEGLVATSGTFANFANKQNILDMLYLYDCVDENLRKHDSRYPTADYLRSVTWQGTSKTYSRPAMEIIGAGKDSEASEKIIALLEKPDSRLVWFCVWGGSCDLAQGLTTRRDVKPSSNGVPRYRTISPNMQIGCCPESIFENREANLKYWTKIERRVNDHWGEVPRLYHWMGIA